MKILVIAEHNNLKLNDSTRHVVTAAQQLGKETDILVMGYRCNSVANSASKLSNIKQVLLADNLCYEHQLAENSAELIISIAKNYDYILAPATTFGKDLLPRVAANLDVEQISDVIQIIDNSTFVRPIYAGNAIATVQTTAHIKLLTIRTTAFNACSETDIPCLIQTIDTCFTAKNTKFISLESTPQNTRPDLSTAKIVIAGGRGLQSKDNFKLLEDLAIILNAAIGASRAAVDAGFVPNDYQIGQTGKIVAPDLYIAVGISGAIQHLAGMKDSKVIVAINKDPEAPIFQVADYGLVGDLFQIVPELISSLKQ